LVLFGLSGFLRREAGCTQLQPREPTDGEAFLDRWPAAAYRRILARASGGEIEFSMKRLRNAD
jgi:hypothetical protein